MKTCGVYNAINQTEIKQATIMATQTHIMESQKSITEKTLPAMEAQATAAMTAAENGKIEARAAKDAAASARESVRLAQESQAAQLMVMGIEQGPLPENATIIKVANTGHSNAEEVRIRSIPVQRIGSNIADFDPWKQYEDFERREQKWTPKDEAWWRSVLSPEKFARYKTRRQVGFDSVIAEVAAGQSVAKVLPVIPPAKLSNAPSRTAIVGFLGWKDERSNRTYKSPLFCFEYIPNSPIYGLCEKPGQ
jgi:hypothetical protein